MTHRDRKRKRLRQSALAILASGGLAVAAWAGDAPVIKGTGEDRPLLLASYQDKGKPTTETVKSEKTTIKTTETTVGTHDYKEVSAFFNVREANSNVTAGETELELGAFWSTGQGGDDNIGPTMSLKHGFTDDLFVEVELLPINIGDGGGQGAGDVALILFYQWLHETDGMPAFATWLEGRFPTGDGSNGVDGELHFNLTKTLAPCFRGHLEGFVKTANGIAGDGDEENIRNFQWGAGPGVDWDLSDQTVAVVNYLNGSSEEYGSSNTQVLELGVAHELAPQQHLKFAFDINLDHDEGAADFAAKIQWSIDW